jgi:hypothetical protein
MSMTPVSNRSVAVRGELYGYVHDGQGAALPGAVVTASSVGATPHYAVSDGAGRYAFRSLPPGSYLVRAYLEGYASPNGRYLNVTAGSRTAWEIALNRAAVSATTSAPSSDSEPRSVLTAGLGGAPAPRTTAPAEREDDSEVEWRLRHSRRGILKDAYDAAIDRSEPQFDDNVVVASLQHSLASPFVSIFDSVNGQVNLLTTTSFDRPQDLFNSSAGAPQTVAFVSLNAPLATGDWAVRGSMTQGDISSWILAGSFTRNPRAANHRYQVGLSYATQTYHGGNAEALTAMRNDSRNVGEIYADDSWDVVPQLTLSAGGRYASYDYLADRFLIGGRLGVAYQPMADDPLRLRVTGVHKEMAPGAEEFVPPASGVWLPPERTFSPLRRGAELRPQKVNTVEISGERPVGADVVVAVRAFRQEVENQLVTVFGSSLVNGAPSFGHYRVASAGDFENYGWGVTVARHVIGSTQASVDYTMTDATRRDASADRLMLRVVAPATLRRHERVHDLTASINSRVAPTATRFVLIYKLNNSYAGTDARQPQPGARFDLQVNQEMPFLNFTGARWEMLVGVRNLFRSDLFDGSVYDELLVVRPPKRITGGVTVWF